MNAIAVLFALAPLFSWTAHAQLWKTTMHPAAKAAAPAACVPHAPERAGETQGYADSLESGNCFVSIHPMAAGMVYRDYAFFGDGMLMVFNSYGDGDGNPNLTSAREYYFFPRRNAPELL